MIGAVGKNTKRKSPGNKKISFFRSEVLGYVKCGCGYLKDVNM